MYSHFRADIWRQHQCKDIVLSPIICTFPPTVVHAQMYVATLILEHC